MQIRVRGLALAFLFLLAFASLASANESQDLTVHLSMSCPYDISICQVSPYQGEPGNPASGLANFNSIDLPWSFSFETAYPSSWQCSGDHCSNYSSTFDMGGTFLMQGPGGVTFSGEITSGTAWENLDLSWGAKLSFSGEWSNGLTASGSFVDEYNDWSGPSAKLDVYTTPEPASLALLGSGLATMWGARKRIFF